MLSLSTFAEGAGGLLFGFVQPAWNPSLMPKVPGTVPDFEYMGGYGYGVTRDGIIIGGFGLSFLDYNVADANASSQLRHFAGGVGGIVVGSRVFGGESAHLDLASRLGVGGMALWTGSNTSTPGSLSDSNTGYMMAYAEPYVELGVGLTSWMHLSATLGYPILGNLIPGKPMTDVSYFSPTIGATLTFGSFRR